MMNCDQESERLQEIGRDKRGRRKCVCVVGGRKAGRGGFSEYYYFYKTIFPLIYGP